MYLCVCIIVKCQRQKIKSVFVGSVGDIFQQEFIFSAFGK